MSSGRRWYRYVSRKFYIQIYIDIIYLQVLCTCSCCCDSNDPLNCQCKQSVCNTCKVRKTRAKYTLFSIFPPLLNLIHFHFRKALKNSPGATKTNRWCMPAYYIIQALMTYSLQGCVQVWSTAIKSWCTEICTCCSSFSDTYRNQLRSRDWYCGSFLKNLNRSERRERRNNQMHITKQWLHSWMCSHIKF